MSGDDDGPNETLGRQFIEKIDAAMLPVFHETVVPIYRYAADLDHARLLGSGSLLRIAARQFLVTAGHVVDEVLECEVQRDDIYVPDLDGAFVPVVGRFVGDRTSRNDLAIVELGGETTDLLRSRRFLTLADTDLSTGVAAAGWYYIHGYPYENATRGSSGGKFRAKAFTFGTRLYAGSTDSLRTYVPGLHVVLEVNAAGVVDGVGNAGTPPASFQGISGSPLWRAFTYGTNPALWTPDHARVVAVETSVTDMGSGMTVVQGTRWFVVLEVLRHAYPDLEPAIALHNPPRVRSTFRWEQEK